MCPASAKTEHLQLFDTRRFKTAYHKEGRGYLQNGSRGYGSDAVWQKRTTLSEALLQKADIYEVDERFETSLAGFTVKVFAVGEEGARVLLMYLGSKGIKPQTDECVMNVKRCLSGASMPSYSGRGELKLRDALYALQRFYTVQEA